MVDIMTHIHQYVPSVSYTEEKIVSGEKVMVTKERMHRLLIGGDQMTAARARSAIKSKINGETPSKKFEGLIPTFEDWHTKANFLGVSLSWAVIIILCVT